MLKISKRFVSIFLSIIMILSVFSIVPFTVSAEAQSETESDEINLAPLSTVFVSSYDGNHSGDCVNDGIYDSDSTSSQNYWAPSWNKELNQGIAPKISIYLPHNVKKISRLVIHWERGVTNRACCLNVETSTLGYNYKDLEGHDPNQWIDIGNESHTINFSGTSGENLRSLRITIAKRGDGNHAVSNVGVTFAEVEIFGTMETMSAKPLYSSHKLEWSANNTNNAAQTKESFTIWQKTSESGTWTTVTPASLTEADVNRSDLVTSRGDAYGLTDRRYYTAIISGIGEGAGDGYQYAVTDSSVTEASQVDENNIGIVTVSGNTGVEALSKNALISLDFGPTGIETNSNNTRSLNNPIILAKLNAMGGGTALTVFSTSNANAKIAQFNASSTEKSYLGLQNGLPHFGSYNYSSTDGSIADNELHSYAFCADGQSHAHHNYDGKAGAAIEGYTLSLNGLTGIQVAGFTGRLYSLIIAEETFDHYDQDTEEHTDLVRRFSIVKPSIELHFTIDEMNEFLSSDAADSYSTEQLQPLRDALAKAQDTLEKFTREEATEEECKGCIRDVDNNYQDLLQGGATYKNITVEAGNGTKSVSITAPEGSQYGDKLRINGNIAHAYAREDINIVINAEPSMDGLTFAGWYIGESRIDGDNTNPQYTYISSNGSTDDVTITAKFTGFNGAPDENETRSTLKKIESSDDINTMMQNSSANSSQSTNNSNATNDAPKFAFDGNTGTWWHQNWDTSTGGDTSLPSESNPIWVQTGFGEGEEDARVIGAIGYLGKGVNYPAGDPKVANFITKYAIEISDTADFADSTRVILSDTAPEQFDDDRYIVEGQIACEQIVYFDAPYTANYVRLIALGGNHVNSEQVSAAEVYLYEYIGAEETVEVPFGIQNDSGVTMTEKTMDVTTHVLLEKDVENAEVSYEDVQDAWLAMSSEEQEECFSGYNTIKEGYTINSVAENEGEEYIQVVTSPREYVLTVNVNGEQYESDSSAYGEVFTKADGGYFDAGELGAGTFSCWKEYKEDGQDGKIISYDERFNQNATGNLYITPVYDSSEVSYGGYIPEPVISHSGNSWLIEIPVTLFNVLEDDPQNVIVKDEVVGYGLVFYPENTTEENLTKKILGTDGGDSVTAKVSKAYESGNTGGKGTANLTNKGRYLHSVTASASSATGIKAYVIVQSGDSRQVYYSNERIIPAGKINRN